jgi:hypothetical protein
MEEDVSKVKSLQFRLIQINLSRKRNEKGSVNEETDHGYGEKLSYQN